MARPAQTTTRSAKLAEEFGEKTARRWFGDEAIDSLPRLQAGKHRGKIKGTLIWRVTTEAGWHPNAGRAVAANTMVRAWIAAGGPFTPEGDAMQGTWLGRTQSLCGSRDVLTAEYREHDAAQQAADRAEMERLRAELADTARAEG